MRRLPALVSTLTSGALYGLCFPTASLRPLAWVALVPFLHAVRRAGLGRALVLGWVWTITAAYAVGDWFPRSVASYYQQPLWIGIALFFGVSSFLAAPYYMTFAACHRALTRRPTVLTPLLVAAAWVAGEWARARLVGGNPWALFGYSQVGLDAMVQIADATSIYGVSFVLVAVNAALAELVAAQHFATAARGALVAAVLAALVPIYGRLRIATLPPPAGPAVDVGLVQGNLDVGTQWSEEFYGKNLDVYLRLTADLLRGGGRPALIVWPENALTFFLEDEALYRTAIGRVLGGAGGAQLLAGGPRMVAGPAGPLYYNSMFVLDSDGTIKGRYDKQHLVPLAERFPFDGLAGLARRYQRVRELSPGPAAAPLATNAGVAGITICSEAMFPEIARVRVRDGAAFFIDPAHDTWLTPKFSAQQFDIVRVRTVEQRRYLARASTSGPSAIVDPLGRVVVRSDFFSRVAITGTIAPRSDVTLYQRVGDAFAALCTLVAGAAWMTRTVMRPGR